MTRPVWNRIKPLLRVNLKNKILFSSVAVVLLVSVCIALVARYILVSSLTRELELRGMGIAESIADRCTGLILTRDKPQLVSLVFEAAQVGERQNLVSYIFIAGTEQNILASTFLRPFPESLLSASDIPEGEAGRVLAVEGPEGGAYDVAMPVKEGIYDIGSVHVGLNKRHIDTVVSKLRLAFLGFMAGIIIIMFFISAMLSRNITRPINQLMHMADEISRDNLAFKIDFKGRAGDEVIQLADSFANMVQHIKEYRNELKKSQQKYRSLFHSGPDPIFVLDCKELTVLDANPMAADMYGFSRKELVGRSFTDLAEDYTVSLLKSFRAADEESLARCVSYSKALHYKNGGDPFNVNVHACGTIYEDQPAIIVSTTDITDMVEKDAQLIQASKMKSLGEMSAGIAHEVNQPLNAIKLGSEYLSMMMEQGMSPTPAQLQKVAEEISAQVDRASEIITTLREFGRKSDITKDKFCMSRPLKSVLSLLGQQMKLENIEIVIDFEDDMPKVLAHRNRMEQVLFNLITNARDAINAREGAKGERRIAVKGFTENGKVALSVIDTGQGIEEGKLDKIFEPFYTTKEVGRGMGLGLAISYGIIKDYHGDISVVSEPGKGTTFTITLPAA